MDRDDRLHLGDTMINFACVGAQKCGTTWLYRMFQQHHGIVMPAKELHFWNAEHPGDPMAWLSRFPDRHDDVRQGEMTPNYCIVPDQRIDAIATVAPNLRIIAMMREPKARAWSAIKMLWSPDLTDAQYCERLERHPGDILAMGRYDEWLPRWRQRFDVLAIDLADIASHPYAVLRRAAQHLDVPYDDFGRIQPDVTSLRFFRGQKRPCPAGLSRMLERHYG